MEEMEQPSLYYEAWLEGLGDDPLGTSTENAGPQGRHFASGGQISPGGTEYLDQTGENAFTGAGLEDHAAPYDTGMDFDSKVLSSGDFSLPLDQHMTGTTDSFKFSTDSYNKEAAPQNPPPNSHPGANMNAFDVASWGHGLDFSIDSMLQPQDGQTFQSIEGPNLIDPGQASRSYLTDFDVQNSLFAGNGFFQQSLPGPHAPLSPALTPPPITSSKSPDILSSYSSDTYSAPLSTDEQRWQATLARSRAADRSFLYGVLTTKIYCRPSCPSRRPTRKHVAFFPFPGAIEAAKNDGFRPCKRCKPEAQGTADTGVLGVVKVLRLIIADASEPFTESQADTKLDSLAEAGGLSAFHFHRLFKATTQMTPGDFIAACRSLALGDAIGKDARGPRAPIDATALINSSARWKLRTARKALGAISPTDYASGALNLPVSRITIDTPQGPMCVVYSSEGGILAALLGLDAEDRTSMRFPNATASEAHAGDMGRCVRELQAAGADREGDIPDDVKPSLWRARVWVKLVRDSVLGAKNVS